MNRFVTVGMGAALLGAAARPAPAAVKTEDVAYQVGEKSFKGLLAWDDAGAGKRPGVLVVHEWWGLNDHAKERARKLAALGYVALALDMYGEGKNTTHPAEAGEMSGAVRKDMAGAKERFLAARKLLADHPRVDPARIAAIGYCFGGSTVLEMARAGVDLRGVVSFHGALEPVSPEAPREIKAKVLVCHGADDPFIPPAQVQAFEDEMRKAGADWQLLVLGGAKHSFTNPGAAKAGVEGLAYSESADRRSWQAMQAFFAEIFAP